MDTPKARSPTKDPDPHCSLPQSIETCYATEQELSQTVQHLAVQNMHLYNSCQHIKNKLQVALKQVDTCSVSWVAERHQHLNTIETLRSELDAITHSCASQQFGGQQLTETDLQTLAGEESDEEHAERNKREMERFKEDLGNKREARHRAISAVSAELERLRGELTDEKLAREKAEVALQRTQGSDVVMHDLKLLRDELLQLSEKHTEILVAKKRLEEENEQLMNNLKEETLKSEADREYSQRRIGALKEVAALSKQMLEIRESQVTDLKGKVRHLETLPAGNNTANSQLQAEYDTQVNNIKSLKNLYEARLKSVAAEKEKYLRECGDKSEELEIIVKKCSELETRLAELEKSAEEREDLNTSLQTRLDLSLEESKSLSTEISLINSTFTQMLVGNSTADLDLDKLTKRLQENHDLITEMTTKEDGSETAASLPKLLLDLINQVHNDETAVASTSGTQEGCTQSQDMEEDQQAAGQDVPLSDKEKPVSHEEVGNSLAVEEIASNLPKVWRILMELLSHHIVPTPAEDNKPSCYKCIDTPTGPQFVPSVSNTYIRLKDLILEKKSLQKDLGKLKQLNGHLESKLQEQEKRLLLVTAELRKTWSVVGRLRSQFKQLHTHEQILRYELQQKRHLLTELKTELEYCREKWEKARQKDRETEVEWKKLRKEFAARKQQDQNNSGESGFSDERENESGDDEAIARLKLSAVNTLTATQTNTSAGQSQDECSKATILTESNPQVNEMKTVETESPCAVVLEGGEDKGSPLLTWLTLLKLFPGDNKIMALENSLVEQAKALESIFCLPQIIVPDQILASISDVGSSPLINRQNQSQESSQTPPCGNSVTGVVSHASTSCSSSSNTITRDALGRTPEEALAARSARLKRLEEQTQILFKKVTRTTNRSMALSNRLEELHGQYGIPNPPPLPQTIPVLRIPLQLPETNITTVETTPADTQETSNEPPETTNLHIGSNQHDL